MSGQFPQRKIAPLGLGLGLELGLGLGLRGGGNFPRGFYRPTIAIDNFRLKKCHIPTNHLVLFYGKWISKFKQFYLRILGNSSCNFILIERSVQNLFF